MQSKLAPTIVAACGLLAVGCALDDSGGSGEAAEFDPPTGVWRYYDDGVVDNTCGMADVYRDPDTQFMLTNNGDGTITVSQATYGDFDCTMSGRSFNCPERLSDSMQVDGTDATLSWSVSIVGEFSSDTEMTGEQHVDIDCEGSTCSLAPQVIGAELPCGYTIEFHAEKQ